MNYKKYNLIQFLAAFEGEYFDIIEPDNLEWAENSITTLLKNPVHQGDCTEESQPCMLCMIEDTLRQYHDYRFNFDSFIKKEGMIIRGTS